MNQAPGALYIGIDVGTSGCRAVLIDDGAQILSEARQPLPETPHTTTHQKIQQPEDWWRALFRCLQDLLRDVPRARVCAVCLDGTSGTVLACDADGIPLGPALLYHDNSCRDQAAFITRHAPADAIARGPESSLAKALYLVEHYPACRHLLHQADWLLGRLSGRFGHSDENNCLKLGYDVQRRCWPAWMQALPLPADCLPHVHAPGTVFARIAMELAEVLDLPREVCVCAGTTDSTAAFLAAGADTVGDAVTSLGSTLVTKVLCEQPVNAPEYGVYSHRLGDLWLAGGASNSGGAVLRHYFSQEELDRLTPLLQAEQETGTDWYPLLEPGERFPVQDPYWPPRMPDADVQQDRHVFLQGLLEGIARIEAQGYRRLQELGAPYPRQVFTTGGGAVNPAWEKIRARLLQCPIRAAAHQEAAYGSALLARQGYLHYRVTSTKIPE